VTGPIEVIEMDEALELIPLGAALAREGLARRSGGNLSYNAGDRIVVTALGADLARLAPVDLVLLGIDGSPLASDGPPRPAEWRLHLAAYRARPTARIVVHAHPPRAIALGLLNERLTAMTPEQFFVLGLHVPVVSYIAPGTPELAAAVARSLAQAPVALLQNQGVIVTGANVQEAHERLAVLEEACDIYLSALAAGEPRVLSEGEAQALDRLASARSRDG
jgi:ribulose-5-phosphate 4-epimerase/fuculose-1-phosphate aldolase